VLAVLRTLLPISEKGRHGNIHSTVKPLDLMRYLCKLTKTPTGGVVLDPFMGSGTTGVACVLEGRDFIGIELNQEYVEIARKRVQDAVGPLFAVES
jgi:DNA modification methylase